MKNRVGYKNITKQGYEIEIIRYRNANDIDIIINDDHKTVIKNRQYYQFKLGNINNPYHRSVLGVGMIGVGEYSARINGEKTIQYKTWFNMLNRCYNKKYHSRHTYENTKVCNEWHNFQNFAKWFDENYYAIDGERMQLDKDILVKNNNKYCPDSCIFVPQKINSMFTKNDINRGRYSIGVSFHKRDSCFSSSCSNPITGKQEWLGNFKTEDLAFIAYKARRECILAEVADLYRDKIPSELYIALKKYKVEPND